MTSKDIREIIDQAATASLGTLSAESCPFVSLITVAATGPRTVVMLLSGLAVHTKNLGRNTAASLLISQPNVDDVDPLTLPRVTLTGSVEKLERGNDEQAREVFLAKHPSALMYVNFADFSFFEFTINQAHLVAGFGRIETISADQL